MRAASQSSPVISRMEAKKTPLRICGRSIGRGQTGDLGVRVSQRYTGDPISIPIRIIRGRKSGPTVFVAGAVHGDETNGMGIVHELMFSNELAVVRGSLILIPVVNVFGFETHQRYMPDRRDLNRSFPGSAAGSLTSRVAHIFFTEVLQKCDFGIDLHTAPTERTNFPNIRGDLSVPGVRRLARAFGCELIINSKGPEGSLRREATKSGCPTVVLEAGESRKIEPRVLEVGVRGVQNILRDLGMIAGEPVGPAHQVRVDRATWVRSDVGGILRFHVSPGDPIEENQPIATNASVFGKEQNVLTSPVAGIVLGMTTLPTVKPGEPVCHIAIPRGSLKAVRRSMAQVGDDKLHERLRRDLATNISVSEREIEPNDLDAADV